MHLLAFHKNFVRLLYFAIVGSCIFPSSADLAAADLKAEEIVARHLDSIGSPQARAGVKSRVLQGPVTYRLLVGGSGTVAGKFQFTSEAPKTDLLLKINANGFLGEWFICDGQKTSVAATYPDKTRSAFGDFVLSQDMILRENLLGGVWSTGWPLLDLEAHKVKLLSEGTKNVDGKEFLALLYQPRKSTDLEILLYFDPQTYRHVMTIYKVELPMTIIGGEIAQTQQQIRRTKIEERFSDFETAEGLTLPSRYNLRFTIEGKGERPSPLTTMQRGPVIPRDRAFFTKAIEWDVTASSIANNLPIDPRTFQSK